MQTSGNTKWAQVLKKKCKLVQLKRQNEIGKFTAGQNWKMENIVIFYEKVFRLQKRRRLLFK